MIKTVIVEHLIEDHFLNPIYIFISFHSVCILLYICYLYYICTLEPTVNRGIVVGCVCPSACL